ITAFTYSWYHSLLIIHSLPTRRSSDLVVLFGILGLFFGSLALCFYLSELIGNSYAGFLIVTGIYLLLAIIIYAIKDKYLEKHIINAAIKKIFSDRNKNQ